MKGIIKMAIITSLPLLLRGSTVTEPLNMAPKSTILKNGIKLLTLKQQRSEMVCFSLVFPGGSVCDPDDKSGLTSLTLSVLNQEAQDKSLLKDVEMAGGTININVGKEWSTVSVEVHRDNIERALSAIHNVISAQPTEDILKIQKDIAAGELTALLDEGQTIAGIALIKNLYSGHPYGRFQGGTFNSIKKLGIADIIWAQKKFFSTSGAILIAVGDIPDSLYEMVEKTFPPSSEPIKKKVMPPLPKLKGRHIIIIDDPKASQTHIAIATMGPSTTSNEYARSYLITTRLGGAFTSRLVNKLRVEKGLTYGVSTRVYPNSLTSAIITSTFTKNATTIEVIDLILKEYDDIIKNGFNKKEIESTKMYIKGALITGGIEPEFETYSGLCNSIAFLEMMGLPSSFWTDFEKEVSSSGYDLKKEAKSILDSQNMMIILVGKFGKDTSAFESIGEIKRLKKNDVLTN